MKQEKIKLLFICLGNICRSPAAEGVMKHIAEREGQQHRFHIDSAGIGGWHVGDLPDIRMRREGERRGYNFNSRARQLTADDFRRFDMILVMDQDNMIQARQRCDDPTFYNKIHLLADYMTKHTKVHAIPDPYYGTEHSFVYALDLIEDACENLYKQYEKRIFDI